MRELLKDKANKFDSITKDADGTKDVRIVRHWWARSPQAASRFTDPTTIRGTAPEIAALTVARDTGEFSFIGGSGARFDGPFTAAGLSADAKPTRNLRGKNVAVRAGLTSAGIAFAVEESDGDYAVFSGMECV